MGAVCTRCRLPCLKRSRLPHFQMTEGLQKLIDHSQRILLFLGASFTAHSYSDRGGVSVFLRRVLAIGSRVRNQSSVAATSVHRFCLQPVRYRGVRRVFQLFEGTAVDISGHDVWSYAQERIATTTRLHSVDDRHLPFLLHHRERAHLPCARRCCAVDLTILVCFGVCVCVCMCRDIPSL